MKLQFNRKIAAPLILILALPTLIKIVGDNYKLAIIDKSSVEQYDLWQNDQEIAVVLETVDNKTLGLSHWNSQLSAVVPFFFEPTSVDLVFSCYPDLLDSEIQEKHLFGDGRGVMFTGRVGQVVVFSKGVL